MSYKRPLYLLPCKSTIILIKRNILGDNYWVVSVGFWVVSFGWWWIVVMGDEGWGRILAFDSFELWRGWWCHRKGGIITAYIRVFFIIKLLSLLTFRVTLLWVNGLDKVIAWQIWQESCFLFFHLSMVACPTSRGFIAARWSFPLLFPNLFGLALSALFVG